MVVVIGSGVIGLTSAYYLLQDGHEVTVVARDMPTRVGEPDHDWPGEWASPWGGAMFHPDPRAEGDERDIQRETFRLWWELYHADPFTGLGFRIARDFYDETSYPGAESKEEDSQNRMWGREFPNFRWLQDHEIPAKAKQKTFGGHVTHGVEYLSASVNPWVYLKWLRTFLERRGVRFVQAEVSSIAEACDQAGDSSKLVVNASGVGAKHMDPVQDPAVKAVRGQTLWVKTSYSGPMVSRTGKFYTYVIPRPMSGGIIIGGISQPGDFSKVVDDAVNRDIITKVDTVCPEMIANARATLFEKGAGPLAVTSEFEGLPVIRKIIGFRPGRDGGYRIEKESISGGFTVIHAYGFEGQGYIYSGGIGQRVAWLAAKKASL